MNKPDWDNYFIMMAWTAATRSVCERRQVGAVIVASDNRIVSTGYNGGIPGYENCPGRAICTHGKGSGCEYTTHAEMNAVAYGDASRMKGATVYTTLVPCADCLSALAGVGVRKVCYATEKPYIHTRDYFYGKTFHEVCSDLGIVTEKLHRSEKYFENLLNMVRREGIPDGYNDPLP